MLRLKFFMFHLLRTLRHVLKTPPLSEFLEIVKRFVGVLSIYFVSDSLFRIPFFSE